MSVVGSKFQVCHAFDPADVGRQQDVARRVPGLGEEGGSGEGGYRDEVVVVIVVGV